MCFYSILLTLHVLIVMYLHSSHVEGVSPNTPTVLWNSMIYPFLNMTIYGAIWYQGEANAGDVSSGDDNVTFISHFVTQGTALISMSVHSLP